MKTFPYFNNKAAQDNAIVSFYEARYAMEYIPERSWWVKRLIEAQHRAHDNAIAKMEVAQGSPTYYARRNPSPAIVSGIAKAA